MPRVRLGLFLCVALVAACKQAETPTTPTPPANAVFYAAIGASDGIGFGSSVLCAPFDPDCPNGTGYVYLLKRRFQAEGRTVTLTNIAVPGSVMSPAIQALARSLARDVPGNFIEQQSLFVPANATHVTIFAGGNDANTIAQALRAGLGGTDIRGYIDRQVQQWGTDLDELIRRIRARAPNARIVALNLPNLAAAPYMAGNTTMERSIMQRIAVGLSDRINALTSQNVLVADLLCDTALYTAANFSSDGFHPSDSGYLRMANLAYPYLLNGSGPAPSPSCAQRTLLPVF